MSKKSINFKNMTEQSMNQISSFKTTMVAIAKENITYHVTMKQLDKKLDAIKENRNNDLDQGIDLNDVLVKYPTLDVEKEIKVEILRHKGVIKPLNEELSSTYAFIPENMYDAYVKKIEEGKRGMFLDSMSEFLNNLGIEEYTDSQVRALAERMSDNLGGIISKADTIADGGNFHDIMRKRTFCKLFMSVFCDLYM